MTVEFRKKILFRNIVFVCTNTFKFQEASFNCNQHIRQNIDGDSDADQSNSFRHFENRCEVKKVFCGLCLKI